MPAGTATELALQDVWPELSAGDVIVDAGDAQYRDAPRRAAALASVGIHFADCGMRDGDSDAATVLLGGSAEAARIVGPLARIAAGKGVYAHCGPAGAGHFVRMVNDGVERAVLRAFAEGAALLRGKREFGLDAVAIAGLLRAGRGANGWSAESGEAGAARSASLVRLRRRQRGDLAVHAGTGIIAGGDARTRRDAGRTGGRTRRAWPDPRGDAADDKDETT